MDIKKISPHLLTASKDNLPDNASKVGQAVHQILSKKQDTITVQEILDASSKRYLEEMESTIEKNFNKFELPFYIVVLSKKEPWALNVMRNYFIARQTRPLCKHLREEYPNFMSTLYEVTRTELRILWSLPIEQDAAVILKNRHLYDPKLVEWIENCNSGKLDQSMQSDAILRH